MASYGWQVSPVPHRRSIMIIEPYTANTGVGSYGHVAWVTGVVPKGGGVFDVKVTEMNAFHGGGGFNKYNSWTYRHVPGKMHYAVATN